MALVYSMFVLKHFFCESSTTGFEARMIIMAYPRMGPEPHSSSLSFMCLAFVNICAKRIVSFLQYYCWNSVQKQSSVCIILLLVVVAISDVHLRTSEYCWGRQQQCECNPSVLYRILCFALWGLCAIFMTKHQKYLVGSRVHQKLLIWRFLAKNQ